MNNESKYDIEFSEPFRKSLKKLIKSHRLSLDKFNRILLVLAADPFAKNLFTHKVNTRILGIRYSSRIDGDLRLIWELQEKKLIILLLDIGGHSGAKKVYK